MKRYYLFLCAIILLVFTACNSTTALNHFKKDPQSANAIQYTKKADLIYNKEINALIIGTYLNNISEEYELDKIDSFLVGIHLVNKDEHDYLKNDYTITSNEKSPISRKKIDGKSKLVSTIPLKNSWANYYLIEFESSESQNINIVFSHPTFGKTVLNFQK